VGNLSDKAVLLALGEQQLAAAWSAELQKLGLAVRLSTDGKLQTEDLRHCNLVLIHTSFTPEPVETVAGLREQGYEGAVIVVTARPSVPDAVALVALDCEDYLPASLPPSMIAQIVAEAIHGEKRTRSRHQLLWRSFRKRDGREHIGSESESFRQTHVQAAQAALGDATVLIQGETGTGKEYLARAVHLMSRRRDKPFIAVNCGAIPETLLESELFGHEKGAFTSANRAKPGLCELAHKGTLFLDEIGDMSLPMQVKMLRFLQDRSITRVGGVETIQVDVRVVAATNQDLWRAMSEGGFREDLYYRLGVLNLWLPPLRERPEDVARFARHFVTKHAVSRPAKTLADDAIAKLQDYHWPGNLRELENVTQRAILRAPASTIRAQHIELDDRLVMNEALRLLPLETRQGA
jgi:two-component system response regulator AtoC